MPRDNTPGRGDFLRAVGAAILAGSLPDRVGETRSPSMITGPHGGIEPHALEEPNLRRRSAHRISPAQNKRPCPREVRSRGYKVRNQCATDSPRPARYAVTDFAVFAGRAMSGVASPEAVEIRGAPRAIFATFRCPSSKSRVPADQVEEAGFSKCMPPHTLRHIWKPGQDEAKQNLKAGRWPDRSFLASLTGRDSSFPTRAKTTVEEMAGTNRLALERSLVSTDPGQAVMPSSIDGMRTFIIGLKKADPSGDQIDATAKRVPATIVESRST